MTAGRDELVKAFADAGRELWVVGGSIRDRLLGLAPARTDEDFATSAMPDEVEAIARGLGCTVNLVGQRFGTVGVLVEGRWSEITTFRGDSYEGGTRWPDVRFGGSIEEDLARRDFTVNALAEDTVTGRMLDLYGGRADLEARLIRAVGDPEERYREDPLRILRGMRFASQLDFEVEAATAAGMAAAVGLIETLSQERVTSELDKLLQGIRPSRGLELMRTSGALEIVLPELAGMPGCEQNRFHFYDVWRHTLSTVDAIAVDGVDPEVRRIRRWTALLHDLGKPSVRHMKANGEWGFYRHETAGAEMATTLLERLRVGRKDSLVIQLLIRRHMDRPDPADRRSVRRFMAKCEGHWRDLVALKRADNASHTYNDDAYHDLLEAACERTEIEESEALLAESPLDGVALMQLFDREPGPWIRRVKQELSQKVLDGELAPGDKVGAERIAKLLMSAEGKNPRGAGRAQR